MTSCNFEEEQECNERDRIFLWTTNTGASRKVRKTEKTKETLRELHRSAVTQYILEKRTMHRNYDEGHEQDQWPRTIRKMVFLQFFKLHLNKKMCNVKCLMNYKFHKILFKKI